MEPEIRDIEIRYVSGGTAMVTAGCFGTLAVHRDNADPQKSTYTVTHLPTGAAAVQGLSRSAAIAIAERLMADPDWRFQTIEQFNRIMPRLRTSLDAAVAAVLS